MTFGIPWQLSRPSCVFDIRCHLGRLIRVHFFRYFYALFIPYFYIEEYAEFNGVTTSISPYLLAILNGCGIPARIIPGFLGDRFGV